MRILDGIVLYVRLNRRADSIHVLRSGGLRCNCRKGSSTIEEQVDVTVTINDRAAIRHKLWNLVKEVNG